MNSTRRVKKSGPSVAAKKSAYGSPQPKKLLMDPNVAMWIGITILIFLLFTGVCYCNGGGGDPFTNIKSGFANVTGGVMSGGDTSGLKELDIVYFMSPTCPWCQKMSKVLSDEGSMSSITVVDISKPQGQEMAKNLGAADKGVPAFISRKMKTGTVGFKPSVKELIGSLNKVAPPQAQSMDQGDAVNHLQDLGVLIFVSPSCGWCTKMKGELAEAGVLEMVELVDVSTEAGKMMAQEVLKESRGVPATYSKKTGKSSVGYKPLPDMIEALS